MHLFTDHCPKLVYSDTTSDSGAAAAVAVTQ